MKTIAEIRSAFMKIYRRANGDRDIVHMLLLPALDRDEDLIVSAAIDELGATRIQRDNALAALRLMLRALNSTMPGVRYLAFQDYALLNNASCAARDVLAKCSEEKSTADAPTPAPGLPPTRP